MALFSRLLCLAGIHRRSSARRRRDADGLYRSVCSRCGIGMMRERQTGRWLVYEDRDRRRRHRRFRRKLDRLTGPVLFLLVLALGFGIAMWLHAPADR